LDLALDSEPLTRRTEVLKQDIVQLPAQAAFPKAARLLKTDEFSSVFRLRPWRRSRDTFRLRRAQLNGFDILVRLHAKIDRKAMPSASSPPLRALVGSELEALFDRAVREAARRRAETVAAPPEAPAVDESSGPSGS
jgi:ribonuclease P protein component